MHRKMQQKGISGHGIIVFSDLIGTDKLLPIQLWDRLLYQVHIMLNMIWPSRCNSNISAHTIMEGKFDFNKKPLALIVTKFIVHEIPNRRSTLGQNRVHGWYIGPEVEHYKCYNVYISNTREERTTDTVELFPNKKTMP